MIKFDNVTHPLFKKITIVIPCYNEVDYIGNLLSDINEQEFCRDINVIISDNNSTDGTLEVIEKCKSELQNINIKVVEGGTVSEGRNTGSEYCETPYIFFIDADVRLLSKSIIRSTWARLSDGDCRLATAKLKSYSPSLLSKFAYWAYNKVHTILTKKYPFASGAYFCLSYEDFQRFGKFDEETENSEDFLFSQNFKPNEFHTMNFYVGLDDRRFKRIGYIGMLIQLVKNFHSYVMGDLNKFKKESGYWEREKE